MPPGLSAAETAAAIREQGGLVGLPHPFDGFRASGGSRAGRRRGAPGRAGRRWSTSSRPTTRAPIARPTRGPRPSRPATSCPASPRPTPTALMELGIASTVLPGPFATRRGAPGAAADATASSRTRLVLRAPLDARWPSSSSACAATAASGRRDPQPGAAVTGSGPAESRPAIPSRHARGHPSAPPTPEPAPESDRGPARQPAALRLPATAARPRPSPRRPGPGRAEAVVDYPLVQEDLGRGRHPHHARLRDRRTQASIIVPVLVLLLFAAALPGFQLDQLVDYILNADPCWLLAAFVIYYLGFPLRGYRWSILLRGIGAQRPRPRLDRDHLRQLARQQRRAGQAGRRLPRLAAQDQLPGLALGDLRDDLHRARLRPRGHRRAGPRRRPSGPSATASRTPCASSWASASSSSAVPRRGALHAAQLRPAARPPAAPADPHRRALRPLRGGRLLARPAPGAARRGS